MTGRRTLDVTVKLLTTTDAALAAGVKPSTIRKWHERGKLTRYGTRRHPRWRLDELTRAATRRVRLPTGHRA